MKMCIYCIVHCVRKAPCLLLKCLECGQGLNYWNQAGTLIVFDTIKVACTSGLKCLYSLVNYF